MDVDDMTSFLMCHTFVLGQYSTFNESRLALLAYAMEESPERSDELRNNRDKCGALS